MNTKLIIGTLFLVIGTLQSCKTPKETVVEEVVTEEVAAERAIGEVRIDESCGVLIRVIQGDVLRMYSPSNLEAKYAKAKTKIEFNFTTTGKKMEGDCSFYEIIEVSNISIVK